MATKSFTGIDKPVQVVTVVGDNGDGTQTNVTYLAAGRAAAASSVPTVQSTEDFNEIKRASACAKTSVAGSGSSVTLLASNANRKAFTITNDSTAILYIDETGGTASSTSYTTYLPGTGGGTPASLRVSNFTGAITGIWASATGNARIGEFT